MLVLDVIITGLPRKTVEPVLEILISHLTNSPGYIRRRHEAVELYRPLKAGAPGTAHPHEFR